MTPLINEKKLKKVLRRDFVLYWSDQRRSWCIGVPGGHDELQFFGRTIQSCFEKYEVYWHKNPGGPK